ncbi:hypothetical protein SNE40_008585 [Patella caerulea]|uniref:DUF19 domain-containing protein n=1 Tax=Patella caerulea TaxID=87958 RepID=A0AAN8JZ64_PATCE
MFPVLFVVLLATQGEGQFLNEVDESDKCVWQVYDCYKELNPIYNAIQSFNLEPLSKGRLLMDICRQLPLAMQCQNAYKCEVSPTSQKYLESSTELYKFICDERAIVKMERRCWKNSDYKKGLKQCTTEFKLSSQNEVCTDMSQLKSCLSQKIETIEDCTILADIFLDYLLDKIATHFIGNVC